MLLVDRLLQQFPTAKRTNLKRMVQSGRVTVNGIKAANLKQPVSEGDKIRVDAAAKPEKESLPFRIVYEDDDIIVIDKPAGLLTSTVPREPRPTALAALRKRGHVGLIHRLDRDARGLLIFSKNSRALASLKRQFFHHTVTRIYQATVSPPPKQTEGRLESVLSERADGTVHSTRGKGPIAITHYQQLRPEGDRAVLRVTLETGKKHQIRVHLSEMGSPVVGDLLYGGKPHAGGSLLLAAVELHVDHPRTGQRMIFHLDEPARMKNK
jgi:23S rRNA pseudouridine1911/1915/1917 synthase